MIKKINKKITVNLAELLKNDAPYLIEDGKINLKKLQSLLEGKTTENEDDRFYFNWAGKDKVFQAIQAPAYSALVPQKDKSIDWDTTENLMIVGENLEVLKLLLKPYFGKVKVIYIDPPYNTGKDFIYKDDFSSPLKDYLERTGQKDENGNRLTTNTEVSGRYHSDWLNFMYPRLFLARNLLKDDGAIFISIDDHEVHHLRMIMDEIFGEDNFVGLFVVNSTPNARDYGHIGKMHDYTMFFSKNLESLTTNLLPDKEKKFTYKDKLGPFNIHPLYNSNVAFNPENRKNLYYPFYLNPNKKDKDGFYEISLEKRDNFIEIYPPQSEKGDAQFVWRWSKQKSQENLNTEIVGYKNEDGEYRIVQKMRHSKKLIRSIISGTEFTSRRGTAEVENLFGKKVFSFPKPVNLIKNYLKIATNKDDIVIDFFAGSGTTGQAVWELNKEDGGNRKFILIQLDEPVDETKETGKNAKKLGLNTIADICIERLRRVSEKLKQSDEKKLIKENENLDLGFKVFNLSPSNFNLKEEFELDQNKDLDQLKEDYLKQLGLYVYQPVVLTAKPIDIVYEIILKNGFSLNSEIEEVKIGSNRFYFVSDKNNALEMYINLETKIDNTSVEEIRTAKYKGKTFAFYDNALTDSQKINLNTFVKLQVI